MRLARRSVLAAPLLLGAGGLPPAARPIDRLATPWWKARHEAKLAALRAKPRVDLLLLGDSITQNLESTGPEPFRDYRGVWAEYFAPRHTFNLGFKGDSTCHLLWRMAHGEVEGLAPRHTVILIGANNMGLVHWPVEQNLLGIQTVVAETRRRLPGTRVILLAVLPSDRSAWVSESTAALNQGLARTYATGPVRFHDAGGLFMRGGRLNHALFYDPMLRPPEPALHPTPEGMALLAKSLIPLLES